MIGAIAGDMIGSEYEFNNICNENFGPLFSKKSTYTDDTVLTIATADTILNGGSYGEQYLAYAQKYANRGYGGNFEAMIKQGRLEPYDSYGNGSAMRVSPVGWACEDHLCDEYNGFLITIKEAKVSSDCSHNHIEGVKGAQAVAGAIYMARKGNDKEAIKKAVEDFTGYDFSSKVSDFKQGKFDVTCQGTLPRCMAIFMETDSYESAMRKAVALGGDVDTNCCVVGGICEAHYGLPEGIAEEVYMRLPQNMADIITVFYRTYIDKDFKEPDVKVASMTFTFEDQLSGLFSSGPATT